MAELSDPKLAEIRDAMDKTTGDGRDLDTARALADAYVETHAMTYTKYQKMPLEELVAKVSRARELGDEDGQWQIEAWLLYQYEPQNIGGTYQAQMRLH